MVRACVLSVACFCISLMRRNKVPLVSSALKAVQEDVQEELQGTNVSVQGCDARGQPLLIIRLGQLEAQQRRRQSSDSSHVEVRVQPPCT